MEEERTLIQKGARKYCQQISTISSIRNRVYPENSSDSKNIIIVILEFINLYYSKFECIQECICEPQLCVNHSIISATEQECSY